MALHRNLYAIALCALIAGCTSSWIADPSPATRNLVNDLRLDGFECNARLSTIECIQKEPVRQKQPSKCDSSKGCVEQPALLLYNRYHIEQQDTGIPTVHHDVVQQVESKLLGGEKGAQQ
ncbi:hypothetical protein CJU35_03880 [Pseudomonas aeruginosa]|nr:hypothetical protein CJU35_03880 [Pseudomonas aeruginosa]